jgi:sulfatase maturation enzyme AslB (radical SAM superfamily)
VVHTFKVKSFIKQKIGRGTKWWKAIEVVEGMEFLFNYLLHHKWQWVKNKTTISEINIEFVSYCNLRCKFCSLDHTKPKKRLSEQTLRHFFEQYLADARFHYIKTFNLHNAGEILLHPELITLLRLFTEYRQKAKDIQVPFPKVALLTNATILTKELSSKILDTGAIDFIRFSMDGGNREAFEEMRTRAKWDVFTRNVKDFIQLNQEKGSQVHTGIISVIPVQRKFSIAWMSEEFKEILNMTNSYELRYAHNFRGEVDNQNQRYAIDKPHKIGCYLLMHQMVLLPDGNFTVCCLDLNGKGVVGNIHQQSLFDIYSSPRRLHMLELFYKRRKREIDMCKNCETF